MHAASREALTKTGQTLDQWIQNSDQAIAAASQTGAELFSIVEVLDGDRGLRVAVADSSVTAEQRSGLMRAVFDGKVSQMTLDLAVEAAKLIWSTPREFRTGLVELGRRALLRSAEKQGQLNQVEDELFSLGRILKDEPQLAQLLGDRNTKADRKRELLANVLYGKVTAVTETLAKQAVGRAEANPIDDLVALAGTAAALRGKEVAVVASAEPLDAIQADQLAAKLSRIYGREMSIHTEVDPSLLGGLVIRVGDEVIDGSTSGKLEKLRTSLV
ncbi:ATP synthase subunit delta [Corynebacterium kalinowskii]|uniref:ATP synthase subunit delta n=1 Tax=Corynebacterium kalinowskii TaxID=2675216 RepID=A0A6B8VCB9_9CORY|nr:F0F1 ATP synthase subunit delta [Corynebacterium kalinowskii]QGU01783.1 ATP synthase subunit delta [Corynebacterium kalinowskii]